MKKFLIYVLSDPLTGQIRYVGKSSSGTQRPLHHATPNKLKKDRTYKGNWIRSLLAKNLRPVIEIVEEFDDSTKLNESEIFYISYFKSLGFKLTNLTNGGDGPSGIKFSEEHKRKIGEAHRGKTVSVETREKIRRNALNRSPDSIRKGVETRTLNGNYKMSCETREKIGNSLRGRVFSAEHRKNLSDARRRQLAREARH